MLSSMGLPVNENTMADCQWLIQNDVPLTEENLTYYEDLKTLELPADPSQAMGQIANYRGKYAKGCNGGRGLQSQRSGTVCRRCD